MKNQKETFAIINNDWSYSYNEGKFVSSKTTPELYTLEEANRIMSAHEGEEDFKGAMIVAFGEMYENYYDSSSNDYSYFAVLAE